MSSQRREKIYSVSTRHVDLGRGQQNLTALAEDVAIQRGAMVAEVLFHIAAIRSLHPQRGGDIVQCVAAWVQDMGASSGQQAAHLLPGQILIATVPVWQLAQVPAGAPADSATPLQADVLRLAQQTQVCFAKTNVLPALFNRADSQAENSAQDRGFAGLKELFRLAVQNLWSNVRVDAASPLAIDRAAVLASLKIWFRQINEVYDMASARKQEAARVAHDSNTKAAREDEARVLAVYADSFKVANPARFVEAHVRDISQRYAVLHF